MASLIDLLRTRKSFDQILKSLSTRIDTEDLEKELSGIQPLVDRAIQGGWIKRHLPKNNNIEDISPINLFVLLVTYSWVYAFENINSNSKANLQLLVVLGKYIWPPYQLFILPDSGKTPGSLSNEDVKNWLMDSRNYQLVIEELDVKIQPEVIGHATVEVRKDSATISRWLVAGLSRLHKEMCTILDIEPVTPGLTQKPTIASSDKLSIPVISDAHENPIWQPPQDQVDECVRIINSPIGKYIASNEIVGVFNDLWQQQKTIPTLRQIGQFYIEQRLGKTRLDNDQRLLAQELLTNIPVWSADAVRVTHPISRGEMENRWKGLYSESISPLINELIEQGLLVQDGLGLRIKSALVFDYFFTRRQFEMPSIYPLPPTDDMQLSRWLYWLLQEYSDRNEADKAGTALWEIQGYLPGFCSGSWEQIASILEIIPNVLISEPRIWILARIAVHCRERIESEDPRIITPAQRLAKLLPDQPIKNATEAIECVNEYETGVNQFIDQVDGLDDIVNLVGFNSFLMTRKRWMLKKHALSSLRLASPDMVVATRFFSFTIDKKTLEKNLLNQLRMAFSDEDILAIAEPLVGWGINKADQYIREMAHSKIENHYRSLILKNGAKGSPGFAGWV